jgi:hypothetical protein
MKLPPRITRLVPALLPPLALAPFIAWAAGATPVAGARGGDVLTQSAWARMLVDRMALAKALPAGGADQSIALLGGRAPGIERDARSATIVVQDGPQRTWKYDLSTTATATWLVTAKNASPAFVSVDKAPSVLTPVTPGG